MKRKPKTSLSHMQRKRFVRILFFLIIFSIIWIVFAPGNGLYFLNQQKKQLILFQEGQKALIKKNQELKQDVERLQNDEEYLEKVAREEHGMLKENEMVFDFSGGKKK